jgi:hypothetical protein
MVRFTVKKKRDLGIAIEYLEGRITGNQAIAAFDDEVKMGRRRGKIREENLPLARPEGLRKAELENARNARAAYAVNVNPATQEQIKLDHSVRKLGHICLSKVWLFGFYDRKNPQREVIT